MDTIIALLIAFATRTAREAAETATATTAPTFYQGGEMVEFIDAYNAEIERIADEACRAYYAEEPEGNWEEAHAIHLAITTQRKARSYGGFASYRR